MLEMNLPYRFVALLLVFQTFVSTVQSDAEGGRVGYVVEDNGRIRPLGCVSSGVTFQSSTTYAGDDNTYAFCDTTTNDRRVVGTSCDGDYVVYTGYDATQENPSGSFTCDPGLACATATVYKYYEDGEGSFPRFVVGCDDAISPVETLFMESPTDVRTSPSPTPTLTPDDDPETVTDDDSSSDTEEPTTVTVVPSETSDSPPPPSSSKDSGPSKGLIAGAVVGSLVGVCLIAGAIILAFRYGRRTPDQEGGGPRPTSYVSTWTNPTQGPSAGAVHNNVPVLQMSTADAGVTTKPEGGSWVASPISPVSNSPVHNSPPPFNAQNRPVAQPPFIGAELPTSLESQGWARSETHPVPYEADSSVAYMPYRPPPA